MKKETQGLRTASPAVSIEKDKQTFNTINQGHSPSEVAQPSGETKDINIHASHEHTQLVLVAQKTKKLTTALYMVSDILSDNEPLKWKIRESGLVLLKEVTELRVDVPSHTFSAFRKKISFRIAEVISLLEVAVVARLISEMNFTLLRKEYSMFMETFEKKSAKTSGLTTAVFPKEFFFEEKITLADKLLFDAHAIQEDRIDLPVESFSIFGDVQDSGSEGQEDPVLKRSEETDEVASRTASNLAPQAPEENIPESTLTPHSPEGATPEEVLSLGTEPAPMFKGQPSQAEMQTPREEGRKKFTVKKVKDTLKSAVFTGSNPLLSASKQKDMRALPIVSSAEVKSERKDKIVGLVMEGNGEGVNIKDIARSVVGCSEKTIQRDLVTLMKDGVLYKTGERRWSRYYLTK